MHVIVLWVAAAITSEYDGCDAFLCTFFKIRSTKTIKSDIVHKRAARVLPLELFNASFFFSAASHVSPSAAAAFLPPTTANLIAWH